MSIEVRPQGYAFPGQRVPQRIGKKVLKPGVLSFFFSSCPCSSFFFFFFSLSFFSPPESISFLSKTFLSETIAIIPTWTGGGKRFEGGVSL